jgi:hypothetical protein
MTLPATGARGGQPIHSALPIETRLALRLVFHRPLRQAEGPLPSSPIISRSISPSPIIRPLSAAGAVRQSN